MTRDGQDWWLFPEQNMEGKFDGMFMSHIANEYYERADKNRGIEKATKISGPSV